ncbi:MAG: LPXTG cell wall anchor domain-containing protein, partial [Butyrivibrio sp.]|nr:LPXTG cell wall anchor domain-containing protein [Butyrivibrio sp.]
TGYKMVSALKKFSLKDFENPTNAEITKIAHDISYGNLSELVSTELKWNATEKSYKANLPAGMFLVLVTSEDKGTVYNPMIISNSYTDANVKSTLGYHTADRFGDAARANGYSLNGDLHGLLIGTDEKPLYAAIAENATLKPVNVYAKRSGVQFNKYIVNSSTTAEKDGLMEKMSDLGIDGKKATLTKADDKRVGDTVEFEVNTVIPDYSDWFDDEAEANVIPETFIFQISDTQEAGLDKVKQENIHIYTIDTDGKQTEVTGNDEVVKSLKVQQNGDGTNGWVLDMQPIYCFDHVGTKVIVRYTTIINADAEIACDANTNESQLKYTTVPGEYAEIDSETNHYTFRFDVIKTNENGAKVLPGAVFELKQIKGNERTELPGSVQKNINDAANFYVETTDEDGIAMFAGLDVGVYELREIEAPVVDGVSYTINDTVYTVSIEAQYDESKKSQLSSYTVTVTNDKNSNKDVITYTAVIDAKGNVTGTAKAATGADIVDMSDTVGIPDTPVKKLPSTGSAGALAMTLLGSVAMAGGAGYILVSRKKKDEDK